MLLNKAQKELDNLARVLQDLGIEVKRPDNPKNMFKFIDIKTPLWKLKSHGYHGNPRDIILVLGDTLINVPCSAKSRYFEDFLYKELLLDYFKKGAKWISAPRPMLDQDSYDTTLHDNSKFQLNDHEPLFDAACAIRFGKDVFVAEDNACNNLGIKWLENHFPQYNFHRLIVSDPRALHLDTTLIPLAPGKMIINKKKINKLPKVFSNWDVREPPEGLDTALKAYASKNLYLNMLSIDGVRILVEEKQKPLIDFLYSWGFEPIPIPFEAHHLFGGGIHCATLDIRRQDECVSYL